MEEYQFRNNNLDTDKFMGQLFVSPLLTTRTFDTYKIKHKIENLENPNNMYNSYIQSQFNLNENNIIFGPQKEEEFILDPFLPLKIEDQNQTQISHNIKLSTYLDPYHENQLQLNQIKRTKL